MNIEDDFEIEMPTRAEAARAWSQELMKRYRERAHQYENGGAAATHAIQSFREEWLFLEGILLENESEMEQDAVAAEQLDGLVQSAAALLESGMLPQVRLVWFQKACRAAALAPAAHCSHSGFWRQLGVGRAYLELGSAGDAKSAYQSVLKIAGQEQDAVGECKALGGLAEANAALGDVSNSFDLFTRQLQAARNRVLVREEVQALDGLARYWLAMDAPENFSQAIACFELQLTHAQSLACSRTQGRAFLGLAEVAESLLEFTLADQYYRRAEAAFEQVDDLPGRAHAYAGRGRTALAFGESTCALEHTHTALASFNNLADRRGQALTYLQLASIHRRLRNASESQRDIYQVLSLTEDPRIEAKALAEWSLLLSDSKDDHAARSKGEDAHQVLQSLGDPAARLLVDRHDYWSWIDWTRTSHYWILVVLFIFLSRVNQTVMPFVIAPLLPREEQNMDPISRWVWMAVVVGVAICLGAWPKVLYYWYFMLGYRAGPLRGGVMSEVAGQSRRGRTRALDVVPVHLLGKLFQLILQRRRS